jgi:hypothetical protein
MNNNMLITYRSPRLSKLYFNYFMLNKNEIKLLEKIKYTSISENIESFLNINNDAKFKELGLGIKYLETLTTLQKRAQDELRKISNGSLILGLRKDVLLISSEIDLFDMKDIDIALLEDVESFLFLLDDKLQDIAISRWGFNHEKDSLEIIGLRHGVTRERVRQLESKINQHITHYLRVHPKIIWQHIKDNIEDDLISLFPKMEICFESNDLFYSFLEICSEVKPGRLLEIAHPKVDKKLLYPYFCNNPSPVVLNDLINELVSLYGYSKLLAKSILRELEKEMQIRIDNNLVYPINLGRKEALAHALIGYPNGLPWKDACKIINLKGFSATKFNEERLVQNIFGESSYVYQCERGAYRNLKYLDISGINISLLLHNILAFFKKNNTNRLHLYDYYKNEKPPIHYYVLRYLVKTFGLAHGIYFDGKSGVDSISSDSNVSQVTQEEIIINALNNSAYSLTKQEIADLLRSKSLKHASFYLDRMSDEGSVVRIDYMTYTTPYCNAPR